MDGVFTMASGDIRYEPERNTEPPMQAPVDGTYGAYYDTAPRELTPYNDPYETNNSGYDTVKSDKKDGFFSKVVSLGKRVVIETKHEITKAAYGVEHKNDRSRSYQRFHKTFHFKEPEPLFHEFACKFASSSRYRSPRRDLESFGKIKSCLIYRSLMIGSAFVTKNFLCFVGSNGSGVVSVVLPLVYVSGIETGSAGFVNQYTKRAPKIIPTSQQPDIIPNAIIVHDLNYLHVHRFYSISTMRETFSILNSCWKSAVAGIFSYRVALLASPDA